MLLSRFSSELIQHTGIAKSRQQTEHLHSTNRREVISLVFLLTAITKLDKAGEKKYSLYE